MEAVILIGLQASGKTTFCREKFFHTHIRLSLDMLKTRHRETILFLACLEGKQPFVIDNTNPTADDRARFIVPAREKGFRVIGYYFKSVVEDALLRNSKRAGACRIPDVGVLATARRLQLPSFVEGFDELYYVEIAADGGFLVKEWQQ